MTITSDSIDSLTKSMIRNASLDAISRLAYRNKVIGVLMIVFVVMFSGLLLFESMQRSVHPMVGIVGILFLLIGGRSWMQIIEFKISVMKLALNPKVIDDIKSGS